MAESQKALETGYFSTVQDSAEDGPVPGCSAEAWARQVEQLQEEQRLQAQLDAHDAWVNEQIEAAEHAGDRGAFKNGVVPVVPFDRDCVCDSAGYLAE